jgi:sugar lactone lactonase YvrE
MARLDLTRIGWVVLAGLLPIIGCGGPDSAGEEEADDRPAPAALVVERVVADDEIGVSLESPFGIAKSPIDQYYLTDAGANRVMRLDAELTAIDNLGGFGFGAGQFNSPGFCHLDNANNLWVSDDGNRRIVRLDARLNFVDELRLLTTDSLSDFGHPSGVAASVYGDLWVADRDRDRIAVFDNVLNFDRLIGDFGYSGGRLASPEKIIIEKNGDFLVCDAGNARLVRYDSYGNYQDEIQLDGYVYPIGAVRDRGRLWVVDHHSSAVLCLNRKGEVVFRTGPQLIGDGTPLRRPTDLVMLPDGKLLVVDSGNARLLVCRIVIDQP